MVCERKKKKNVISACIAFARSQPTIFSFIAEFCDSKREIRDEQVPPIVQIISNGNSLSLFFPTSVGRHKSYQFFETNDDERGFLPIINLIAMKRSTEIRFHELTKFLMRLAAQSADSAGQVRSSVTPRTSSRNSNSQNPGDTRHNSRALLATHTSSCYKNIHAKHVDNTYNGPLGIAKIPPKKLRKYAADSREYVAIVYT